jgi:CRP-like cAMP-binding protein
MKTILLIEDSDDVRENTAEILELAGYKVLAAANGKLGVELAMQEIPDLIICDIMMPVLDGYGVLHLLGKKAETSSIPFIFLTAKAERSDIRKGMEMGADDYLTKPFDDTELLNAVESRFKKMAKIEQAIGSAKSGVNDLLGSLHELQDIRKISERQHVKSYRKKDLIFSEGDTPVGLYLLEKGKIKIYKSHELGKDLITRLLQPGDFFGYLPLLENTAHTSSAEALEDVEITVFPIDDFFTLLERSPQVSKKFVELLAGKMHEEQEKLLALAYSSVRKRTAEALLTLRDRYHDGSDKEFTMAIARDDLANMVGTATESLIRTLSDFRAEGLIHIAGSSITIVNVEKLRAMKN